MSGRGYIVLPPSLAHLAEWQDRFGNNCVSFRKWLGETTPHDETLSQEGLGWGEEMQGKGVGAPAALTRVTALAVLRTRAALRLGLSALIAWRMVR